MNPMQSPNVGVGGEDFGGKESKVDFLHQKYPRQGQIYEKNGRRREVLDVRHEPDHTVFIAYRHLGMWSGKYISLRAWQRWREGAVLVAS